MNAMTPNLRTGASARLTPANVFAEVRLAPFEFPAYASAIQATIARDMIEDVTNEQKRRGLRPGAMPAGSVKVAVQVNADRMARAVQQQILRLMADAPGIPLGTADLRRVMDIKPDKLREVLMQLINEGWITRSGTGPYRYQLTEAQRDQVISQKRTA